MHKNRQSTELQGFWMLILPLLALACVLLLMLPHSVSGFHVQEKLDTRIISDGCPENCHDHGTCDTEIGGCKCFSNSTHGFWDGLDCGKCLSPYEGVECNELPCPNNCSDHGTCNTENGECTCFRNSTHGFWNETNCGKCLSPYEGEKCNELPCPKDCSGHGTCNSTTGTCKCEDTFEGDDCSLRKCPEPNCSGHGTCNSTTGTCTCTFGWHGESCQLQTEIQNDLGPIQGLSWILTLLGIVCTAGVVSIISLNFRGTALLGLRGYVMGLVDTIQFAGVVELMGNAVPPLYLKFAVFLSSSNFFFNFWTLNNGTLEVFKELVFLMNFLMVGTLALLTVLICLSIIGIRVKFLNLQQNPREKFFSLCIPSLLRIALLVYSGISVSSAFQISQAFYGISPLYHPLNIMAAIVFLVFNVGFILGVIFILLRKSVLLKDANFKRRFGCLYNEFRDDFYLFEAVVLFKKLVLGTMIGFFQYNAGIQLMVISVLFLVYLVMLLTLQPYSTRRKNYLEMALVVVQAATILLVYMSWGVEGTFLFVLSLVVIALICSIAVAFVLSLILDIFMRRKPLLRKAVRTTSPRAAEEELQEQHNQPQVHVLLDDDDPDALIFEEDEDQPEASSNNENNDNEEEPAHTDDASVHQ